MTSKEPGDSPSRSSSSLIDTSEGLYRLVKIGLRLRLINILAVACSFVGALCMCIVGLIKTIKAVRVFFLEDLAGEKVAESVTAYVVQAMDAFVIAMVLVVFSTGIFHLFIMELKKEDFKGLRGFERINSIKGLKKILGEMIIIVLFVHFLNLVIENATLEWTILTIPASVLLMAGALKLLNLGDKEKNKPKN
ncbi:MAG: YqhA family protein [Verrucomicrobia bacterium]|nr:YqhA family protein [Verrucomicrobiota bacterium]